MKKRDEQKTPKRVKVKRRLTLFLAVIAALAVAYFVLTKSRLVPYQVSKYLNQHLLDDTRFDFTCGKVTGDLVRNVVLHDPVVRYHGDDASYNVFRADEISISYSLTGVLRMNLVVNDLRLRNVGLQIRQGEDGRVVLPIPVKDELMESSGVFAPRVDVQQFSIDGLHLYFGGVGRELAVRDVNLEGSYRLEGGVGRIRIDRGNAFILGSETPVQSVEMDVYHEKESVRVGDFSMRVGRSLIMSNGKVQGGRFERFQFIFNPVVLGELHQLGLIPDLEGELAGNVRLNGPVVSPQLEGTVTGTAFGLVMNSLNFDATIAGTEIAFDTLWGGVYGAELGGKFRYGWGAKKGFWYEGDFRGLDLRQRFLPDAGLPEMDLYGHGSITYDGQSRYVINARADSARIDRYRAGRVDFDAAWIDDVGLVIDDIRLERPGYAINISGLVDDGGGTDAVFDATGTDWSYFWDYVSVPQISGAIAVGGKLAGPIENLQINVNGSVEDVGYLFAGIDSAQVQAEIRGVGGDDVSATVDVSGRNVLLAGKSFESPHLLLEVSDGTTFVRDFSFSRGDSFVTSDFEVSTVEDGTNILLKHIAVDLRSQQWRNESVSTLVVGEGEMRLDSLVFASGNSYVGFGGNYSERDGSLQMTGRGRDFELGLLQDALELPFRLEGRGDFRAHIDGEIDNPAVELAADLRSGVVDSLQFDSLQLRAAFDHDLWRLDELLVVTRGDSLNATGWWASKMSPVAVVTGGADIRGGLDRPFQLDVDSRHYPVPAVMKAVHAPGHVEGAFTGSATFRNTFADPYVSIAGRLQPRSATAGGEATAEFPTKSTLWSPLMLPPTDIRLEHRDGTILLSQVSVGGGVDATLTGEIPVSLDLLTGLEPRIHEPLRLELTLQSSDIAPMIVYTTRLSQLDGRADGKVTVGGTLADPVFDGGISLKGCAVRFADLDETYIGIDAMLDFRDSLIVLTSLDGESRGATAFTGSGMVELDGFRPIDYRLDLAFDNFWVKRQPDFEALVDGRLTVTAYEEANRRIPSINGSITLKQAEIIYTFESYGAGASTVTLPTASPGWICSIDLDAHKNLWVRNPDMNVELGGQLILKRDQQGLYLRGDLNALRGSYKLYNNKFHIIDGSLDFSAAEGFRPEVFINAYTPHRVEDGQERRIYLTLTWPRDKIEPEIQLSYDEPGYYQSDLWRMLGGTDIAGGLAANTLEKILNQQMSGMTVYVDRQDAGQSTRGGTSEQQMMIGVGKYLWEDVYLTYRQGLTLTADQAVQVEYRLRNMIYIRSGVIRHTNPRYYGSILRSVDEYNLDVKFRWEY